MAGWLAGSLYNDVIWTSLSSPSSESVERSALSMQDTVEFLFSGSPFSETLRKRSQLFLLKIVALS